MLINLLEFGLCVTALWGNSVLWLVLFDLVLRSEASRWLSRSGRLFSLLGLAFLPAVLAVTYFLTNTRLLDQWRTLEFTPLSLYALACVLIAIFTAPSMLYPHGRDDPAVLVTNHSTLLDINSLLEVPGLDGAISKLFGRIPGNQILHLSTHKEKIRLPRLSSTLEGYSITHVSDLHFTGHITKPFFEEVVQRTNELDGDLIAITGDIVDCEACFEWIPDTLGQLRARDGVYFVLGNHDKRVDSEQLRRELTACGLIDLGGRWQEVTLRGETVILAGNELPWFPPAPDMESCPPRSTSGALRILLAHSPDQLQWARQHDIDLMLAGHTHGGQIHFPWVGPLVTATRTGRPYAVGLIRKPPTVLHVSRGISQTVPLRFRCPPEIARLELQRA